MDVEQTPAEEGQVLNGELNEAGNLMVTTSEDGYIKLWDFAANPKEPKLLADLHGHTGAVNQASWAPAECGVLVASAGADGCVSIWGRGHLTGWRQVKSFLLDTHGAVKALAWAAAEYGLVLACASADGTITVISHLGSVRSGDSTVDHRWQTSTFPAHREEASSLSWSSSPSDLNAAVGGSMTPNLSGARLATAGTEGLKVWRWDDHTCAWLPEEVRSSASFAASKGSIRSVAWQPFDGLGETIATASGNHVVLWAEVAGDRSWRPADEVDLGEAVWRVQWAHIGRMLVVCCGEARCTKLLKQQLNGRWESISVTEGILRGGG